jgi:hypothetical protein
MVLASCNFSLEQISVGMRIPERTLSRHFAEELATGKLRVHAEIAAGIVEAALNGDTTMSILYAKARVGWHERTSFGFEQENPRQPFHIQISGPAIGEDQR